MYFVSSAMLVAKRWTENVQHDSAAVSCPTTVADRHVI